MPGEGRVSYGRKGRKRLHTIVLKAVPGGDEQIGRA